MSNRNHLTFAVPDSKEGGGEGGCDEDSHKMKMPKLKSALPASKKQQQDQEENQKSSSSSSATSAASSSSSSAASQKQAVPEADKFSLKHGSYSCEGLTIGEGSRHSVHIEALPFSFLFGLPLDEYKDELKYIDMQLKEEQKLNSSNNNNNNNEKKEEETKTGNEDEGEQKKKFKFAPSAYSAWKTKRIALDFAESTKRQVLIPLFQRSFAWLSEGKNSQAEKWFNDVVKNFSKNIFDKTCKENNRIIARHGTGKIVMRKEKVEKLEEENTIRDVDSLLKLEKGKTNRWICVDGQQRITCSSLLFAAMFFSLMEIKKEAGSTQAIQNAESLLLQCLFIDPEGAQKWARGQAKKVIQFLEENNNKNNNKNNNQEEFENELSDLIWPEGIRLESFARLVPSYVDSKYFNEIITRQLVVNAVNDENKSKKMETKISPVCRSSLQGKMFLFFIPKVQTFIASQLRQFQEDVEKQQEEGGKKEIPEEKLLQAEAESIFNLARHFLAGFGFVLVDLINPNANLASVFLWFQEKSLTGFGALLQNDAPGVDFTAHDCVRNLVLSPYMNLPDMNEQLRIYEEKWRKPIDGPAFNAIFKMRKLMDATISSSSSSASSNSNCSSSSSSSSSSLVSASASASSSNQNQNHQQQQLKQNNSNNNSNQDNDEDDEDEDSSRDSPRANSFEDEFDEKAMEEREKEKLKKKQQTLLTIKPQTFPTRDSLLTLLVEQLESEQLEKRNFKATNKNQLFKSSFQTQSERAIMMLAPAMATKKKDLSGFILYMRFYSAFEWLLNERETNERRREGNHQQHLQEDEQQEQQEGSSSKKQEVERKPQSEIEREMCEYILKRLSSVTIEFVSSLEDLSWFSKNTSVSSAGSETDIFLNLISQAAPIAQNQKTKMKMFPPPPTTLAGASTGITTVAGLPTLPVARARDSSS